MTTHPDIGDDAIFRVRSAARFGSQNGKMEDPFQRAYLRRCSHLHYRTGTIIIFTRDTGHHSSGWMKNPDFERCLHLSLSFRAPDRTADPNRLAYTHTLAILGAYRPLAPFDSALAAAWANLILGDNTRLAWHEHAFSKEGRHLGVEHWRVFCDPAWNAIMPRGEVYAKRLTEAGWRSWSEVQGADTPPNTVSAE